MDSRVAVEMASIGLGDRCEMMREGGERIKNEASLLILELYHSSKKINKYREASFGEKR